MVETEARKEYKRKWYLAHPGYGKAAFIKYKTKNPDKVKASDKKYKSTHKEEIKKYEAKPETKVRRSIINKKWVSVPKNKVLKQKITKRWEKEHPNEMRTFWSKNTHRRQRDLGFIPLNTYFPESNAHHIDTERVIYIPECLHKSIPHDQKKPDSMKKINILAWSYLEFSSY